MGALAFMMSAGDTAKGTWTANQIFDAAKGSYEH